MHNAVRLFIQSVKGELPYKFKFRSVLEVGSHNINGSPRKYFLFCDYTGIDIGEGKGVDIVTRFNEHEFDRKYEVIISTEMLEHDSTWQQSLRKMYELLEDNGLLIITCAAPERKEHGTKRTSPQCSPDTTDYYRNISIDDLKSVLTPDMFGEYVVQYARGGNDLQMYGIKSGSNVGRRNVKVILKNILKAFA